MGDRRSCRHVVQRFPERWREIVAMAQASEDFDVLCDDYSEAVDALRRWQTALSDPAASDRIEEFRQLADALEQQILVELARDADRSSS